MISDAKIEIIFHREGYDIRVKQTCTVAEGLPAGPNPDEEITLYTERIPGGGEDLRGMSEDELTVFKGSLRHSVDAVIDLMLEAAPGA